MEYSNVPHGYRRKAQKKYNHIQIHEVHHLLKKAYVQNWMSMERNVSTVKVSGTWRTSTTMSSNPWVFYLYIWQGATWELTARGRRQKKKQKCAFRKTCEFESLDNFSSGGSWPLGFATMANIFAEWGWATLRILQLKLSPLIWYKNKSHNRALPVAEWVFGCFERSAKEQRAALCIVLLNSNERIDLIE